MTIQLLTSGVGIFVERDEFFTHDGAVHIAVNGLEGGKLYHNHAPAKQDENGLFSVVLKKGQNSFSYRKGTIRYNIEPIYYNGHHAVVEGIIGTTKHYAEVAIDIIRLKERIETLEREQIQTAQQIKDTKFLF